MRTFARFRFRFDTLSVQRRKKNGRKTYVKLLNESGNTISNKRYHTGTSLGVLRTRQGAENIRMAKQRNTKLLNRCKLRR